jgi:hypothetical protein
VSAFERRELASAQCTAEQHRKDCTVPFSFDGVDLWPGEQVARLFPREPVPCPFAGLPDHHRFSDPAHPARAVAEESGV